MSSVSCTPEMKKFIADIDLLIFDVDGVLIDTSHSFIATVIDTACYYIKSVLELPIDLSCLSVDDAHKFKRYTGYNNDWDLTEGMVIFQILNYKDNRIFLDLDDFLLKVDGKGGGLHGITAILEEYCDKETLNWIREKIDKDTIKRAFQEIYGGERYCESFYGFKPGMYKGAGSVESEIIMLDHDLMQQWKGKIGILTGRMKNETDFALRMLKFNSLDSELIQYSGNELPDKPDPAKMIRIIRNAQSNNTLFIGDSIDDYLSVFNYNNLEEPGRLGFGLIADTWENFPVDAQKFNAGSVNDLLGFIIRNHSKNGSMQK
jgi:HAD superfamily phosphatase